MDIRECYEAMGASYDDVLARFRSDDRIKRFLMLFPKDESFALLEQSMGSKDYQTAFRASHTLKGVAMNLALSTLANSSSALTEALRDGEVKGDVDALYAQVQNDYRLTIECIEKLS